MILFSNILIETPVSRDVHLSHFRIFLQIGFQKMRMTVLRNECDFAEKSGQFCDFAAKI